VKVPAQDRLSTRILRANRPVTGIFRTAPGPAGTAGFSFLFSSSLHPSAIPMGADRANAFRTINAQYLPRNRRDPRLSRARGISYCFLPVT